MYQMCNIMYQMCNVMYQSNVPKLSMNVSSHRLPWVPEASRALLLSHITRLLCFLYFRRSTSLWTRARFLSLIRKHPQSGCFAGARSPTDFGSIKHCDWATRIAYACSQLAWFRGIEHLSPLELHVTNIV